MASYYTNYPTLNIAIIGTKSYTTTLGASKTVLHAIPVYQVRKGLTREQYREHLEEEGIIMDGHIQDRY